MGRRRAPRGRLAVWAPVVAGRLLRQLGRGAPGVLGPLLVAVGAGMAWLPLGVIVAGAFLLALDWRIPDEPPAAAARGLRVVA